MKKYTIVFGSIMATLSIVLSLLAISCEHKNKTPLQQICFDCPLNYQWATASDTEDEAPLYVTVIPRLDKVVISVENGETTTYFGKWSKRQSSWIFNTPSCNIMITRHATTVFIGDWWIRYADYSQN